MYLQITTPNRKIYEGNIANITLPGALGPFQVLKGHMPLVSILVAGAVLYAQADKLHKLPIKGGIVEIFDDQICVLLDRFDS